MYPTLFQQNEQQVKNRDKTSSSRLFKLTFTSLWIAFLVWGLSACVRGGDCRSDRACETSQVCRVGLCTPMSLLIKNGNSCTQNHQCLSTYCIDSVCQHKPSTEEALEEPHFEAPQDNLPDSKPSLDAGERVPEQASEKRPGSDREGPDSEACKQLLCPIWGMKAGGFSYETGLDLAVHTNGDIYVIGTFLGTTRLGSMTFTAGIGRDTFVGKLSKEGTWKWLYHLKGLRRGSSRLGQVLGTRIKVDAKGNAYVIGGFLGHLTIEKKNATKVYTTYNRQLNANDSFIVKFSPTGEVLWSRQFGSKGHDSLNELIPSKNRLYILGSYEGNAFFDNQSLQSKYPEDLYKGILLELDTDGNLKTFTHLGPTIISASSMTLAPSGTLYIAHATQRRTAPKTTQRALLAWENGKVIWSQPVPVRVISKVIAVGKDAVYIAGQFSKEAVFADNLTLQPASPTSLFVAQLDTKNQTFLWAKQIPNTGFKALFQTTSSQQLIYTSAFKQVFTLGNQTLTPLPEAHRTAYIALLSKEGKWLGAKAFLATKHSEIKSIQQSPKGPIYLTGYFDGHLYWPFQRSKEHTKNIESTGKEDFFLFKLQFNSP